MKKGTQRWGMIAGLLVAATTCTQAAELGGFATYLDGDNLGGDGSGAGALLRFGGSRSPLSLDVRCSYVSFDKLSMIPLEVALRLRVPVGPLGAFAGLGGGYYYLDPDTGAADDNVGAFPFVGLDVGLGERAVLFGEVRWLYLETDIDSAVNNAEDISVDGLGVNLGLMLTF